MDFALYCAIELSGRVKGELGRNVCVIRRENFDGGVIPKQFHPLFYPKTFLTKTKVITFKEGEKSERQFWKSLQSFWCVRGCNKS